MGSSRRSKSSRAGKASPAKPSKQKVDLNEALYNFSEALAIVETVCRALQAAESALECSTVGAEIATLQQGVRALVSAYEEIDRAIPGLAS